MAVRQACRGGRGCQAVTRKGCPRSPLAGAATAREGAHQPGSSRAPSRGCDCLNSASGPSPRLGGERSHCPSVLITLLEQAQMGSQGPWITKTPPTREVPRGCRLPAPPQGPRTKKRDSLFWNVLSETPAPRPADRGACCQARPRSAGVQSTCGTPGLPRLRIYRPGAFPPCFQGLIAFSQLRNAPAVSRITVCFVGLPWVGLLLQLQVLHTVTGGPEHGSPHTRPRVSPGCLPQWAWAWRECACVTHRCCRIPAAPTAW